MKSREKPSEEPELEDVLSDFDSRDLALQMTYQQYIEKPSQDRLHKVQQESDSLVGAFGQLVRKTLRGTDPIFVDDDKRNALVAMILVAANNEHSKCIGDYADVVELSTDEELAAAKTRLIECLNETPSLQNEIVYIDHVVSHLKDILSSDWDAIEAAVEERQSRLQARLLRGLGEAAKISTAVVVGLVVAEAIKRKH
jgi:hypothetical protein